METTFAVRLISPAGFSRVEVPMSATFLDLKKQITHLINVHVKDQKLYYDSANKKPINVPDSTPVVKLGLKLGDTIFLANKEAEMILYDKNIEDNKDAIRKCAHSERETCINCIDKKTKKTEITINDKLLEKEGLTKRCNHGPGQKCLNCMQAPVYKEGIKYNCQHGENGMCPNCIGKEFIADAKHKSFDQVLKENRMKCKGVHDDNSKCNNCLPPNELSFLMKKNCPNHLPYPEGLCSQCMPPNAILGRQRYRHVDYVSFMNQEEVNAFVNLWMNGFCMKQRMGYLFGYYASDPNYQEGVRAVVEAIYEPPQLGDTNSVSPINDPDENVIESIANSLTLECIGWIFTSINTEKDVCMTSYDVRKAAKLQQQHLTEHDSGYKISRFITVVVKPKEEGQADIECYMVSDLCQALERDGVFDDSKSKKEMQVRKAEKNEVLPTIYMENRPVETFDPDFFIVNLSHGAPVDKKNQNILKTYDFPVASRTERGILTESQIKDYFKKNKKVSPNIKYANFYFLIYLAKVLDLQTAEHIADKIANEGKVDGEIIEEMLSTILGYD